MNTNNVKIEFSLSVSPDGTLSRKEFQDACEAHFASLQAKLAVNYDVITELLSNYLVEPKNVGLVNVSPSALITTLWKRMEKSGKTPDAEEDPKGYMVAEEHFAQTFKNYLRSEPDFFDIGEGRGASVVGIRCVPGESLRDPKTGEVRTGPDGEFLQRYRMSREDWALVEAKRALAAQRKAVKAKEKAAKGEATTADDDSPESLSAAAQ